MIFGYGTVLGYAISTFGIASSPWFAVLPPVGFLVPIFFDRRAGYVAFAYILVAVGGLSLLELSGLIPFAPLMLLRTIDAQRTTGCHTPEHAVRAVEMALAMQARTAALAQKWSDEGIEAPFRVRVGINTGAASVGNFGSAGRMDYTAIGNQVNLAARVQQRCPAGGVLIHPCDLGAREGALLLRADGGDRGQGHPLSRQGVRGARRGGCGGHGERIATSSPLRAANFRHAMIADDRSGGCVAGALR